MRTMRPLYRHSGVGLLRAAAASLEQVLGSWPDLSDIEACRAWLMQMWSRPELAEAIRGASPTLADRLNAIHASGAGPIKQIRRATVAVMRYVLRATGRHTPFGLFAGVAPVRVGHPCQVRWGEGHRPVARVDIQWLANVVAGLEARSDLLERLDVVFTNLVVQRGRRLEAPDGPNRVTIRFTSAVRAVRDAAATPIRFGILADKLVEIFPTASLSTVRGLLIELVQRGFSYHVPARSVDDYRSARSCS
jgi:hypothetical protein